MAPNKLENYLALLTIRRAGRRRDTFVIGGIFIISFLSMSALGMLNRLSERSMVIIAAMVFCFGFAYLTSWVRLEIIKGTIELIENLLQME
jgi:quinol-cytochrome oxidoreductase complex cytochrome b subunit